MKSKVKKQLEALARIDAHVAKLASEIAVYKAKAKTWTKPVVTAESTLAERHWALHASTENPFLSLVERENRHLERLCKEKFHLERIIAESKRYA